MPHDMQCWSALNREHLPSTLWMQIGLFILVWCIFHIEIEIWHWNFELKKYTCCMYHTPQLYSICPAVLKYPLLLCENVESINALTSNWSMKHYNFVHIMFWISASYYVQNKIEFHTCAFLIQYLLQEWTRWRISLQVICLLFVQFPKHEITDLYVTVYNRPGFHNLFLSWVPML